MRLLCAIREYVKRELIGDENIDLDDDTPLLEKGYLTSLQAVQLVSYLEERFSAVIDPEELTEENFRDLASIALLVERKELAR